MKKPSDALEKEFNDAGIFFLEAASLDDKYFEGAYVGLEVELGFPPEIAEALAAPDFSVSVINRRGVSIVATDWKLTDRDGFKVLGFKVSQRVPDSDIPSIYFARNMGMTFQDLCYFAGNEAVDANYQVDTLLQPRPGTKLADLGWHLPSRFVDAVIDALGKLNDSMLSGNLENALLYGVVTKP